MFISIVNLTMGKLMDEDLQTALRAINRQISDDFEPHWSFGARLRLEGVIGGAPRPQALSEMRGDALVYVVDRTDAEDTLGYHDRNNRGIPFGIVSLQESENAGEDWTVTLSHEALELLGDPQSNLLVRGPHPGDRRRMVFHWFEMCDAVQAEHYAIDGINVANFVLPSYFTRTDERGSRNDFLGRLGDGGVLASFGVSPGGYVGFFDPAANRDEQYWYPDDDAAAAAAARKRKAKTGRGWRRLHPRSGA
ncbi:MAG TPA: hypothetical protein VGI14_12145 [Casimicrobiaceae bacterium]